MREHLVNCKPYQDLLQSTVKDGDKRHVNEQQIDEVEAARLGRRQAIAVAKNPYYIAAAPKSNKAVDKLYAKTTFSSCCSFSIFESPEWVDFFYSVGYYPPKRTQRSTTLLDDVYIEDKEGGDRKICLLRVSWDRPRRIFECCWHQCVKKIIKVINYI